MGFFGGLFAPKDFKGRVEKLFSHFKYDTRIVSSGMIVSVGQLYGVLRSLCFILDVDHEALEYAEVEELAQMYVTVASRSVMAVSLGSSGLIERTPEVLMNRYSKWIPSRNVADKISYFLLESARNKTDKPDYYVQIANNAKSGQY